MQPSELLKMRVGTLFKLHAHTLKPARYCIGTVTAIWAPKAISALMHSGRYKNETIHLRGFDFDQMELLEDVKRAKLSQ